MTMIKQKWRLSFERDASLGTCIVEADTIEDAIEESWRQKCNPGGVVHISSLDVNHIVIQHLVEQIGINKLVSSQRLKELGYMSMGEVEDLSTKQRIEMQTNLETRALDHMMKKGS